MATKKASAKKAPEKTEEPQQEAPKKKPPGRPPKLAEVTELDLGPKLTALVHRVATRNNIPTGDVVRALVRLAGRGLAKSGVMGVDMKLRRFF